MISYKLAKQLKDAGFPQRDAEQYTSDGQWIPKKEQRYIPALSELIMACGKNFGVLNCFYEGDDETKTLEQIKKENPGTTYYNFFQCSVGWHCSNKDTSIHVYDCSTPEEAVAKLWLALNKK